MSHLSSPHVRRRRQTGFTLTELMVAITGGLLLAIAVFALARDSTRFYRREARIGDATQAALVGFQRLQADIQRAGLMASTNIQRDDRLCTRPPAPGFPARMMELGAIRITDSTQSFPSVFSNALNATTGPSGSLPLTPDVLTVAGAFTSPDDFPIHNVEQLAGAFRVYLQDEIGPLARLRFAPNGAGGASPLDDTQRNRLIQGLFPVDRALRIVDLAGKHYYGRITGAGFSTNSSIGAYVDLDGALPLDLKKASSTRCGLSSGGFANVVNFVRYEIRPKSAGGSGAGGAGPSGSELTLFEQTRTDLVRYEVDVYNNPIQNTDEVVAEYGVDLRFAVGVATNDGPDPVDALTFRDESDRDARAVYTGGRTFAGTGNSADIGRPDNIVVVRARLSVRSAMPDRYGGIPDDGSVGRGFYRMWLGQRNMPDGATRQFWARVRTLQADISLRNGKR